MTKQQEDILKQVGEILSNAGFEIVNKRTVYDEPCWIFDISENLAVIKLSGAKKLLEVRRTNDVIEIWYEDHQGATMKVPFMSEYNLHIEFLITSSMDFGNTIFAEKLNPIIKKADFENGILALASKSKIK